MLASSSFDRQRPSISTETPTHASGQIGVFLVTPNRLIYFTVFLNRR
jgi:hypothetical protein